MRRIGVAQAAMATGSVTATWQLIWVMLVAAGWGRPFLEFVLELRFTKVSYAVAPFSTVLALYAIALAFCGGALTGVIFSLTWNWLTYESEPRWARDTHERVLDPLTTAFGAPLPHHDFTGDPR